MGHHTARAVGLRKDERGVLAVEVLVVVGIVVALVVVAVVSVRGIRDRQRTTACKSELAKLHTAVEAFRALPAAQNPGGAPPASVAVLQFSGLLEGKVGRYVTYSRVRTQGHWEARYADGPKGNCAPN